MFEQERVMKALETAIRMEIDGKAFYLKASKESTHEIGRKLLAMLADEEDQHRIKFETIYNVLSREKDWPEVEIEVLNSGRFKNIFSEAIRDENKPASSELDAVKIALDMEVKSYDFYKSHARIADSPAEKRFFEAIASEERGHQLALIDYQEYLNDPGGWFALKEHHSLDGA